VQSQPIANDLAPHKALRQGTATSGGVVLDEAAALLRMVMVEREFVEGTAAGGAPHSVEVCPHSCISCGPLLDIEITVYECISRDSTACILWRACGRVLLVMITM
jgi:hypothetical protein